MLPRNLAARARSGRIHGPNAGWNRGRAERGHRRLLGWAAGTQPFHAPARSGSGVMLPLTLGAKGAHALANNAAFDDGTTLPAGLATAAVDVELMRKIAVATVFVCEIS